MTGPQNSSSQQNSTAPKDAFAAIEMHVNLLKNAIEGMIQEHKNTMQLLLKRLRKDESAKKTVATVKRRLRELTTTVQGVMYQLKEERRYLIAELTKIKTELARTQTALTTTQQELQHRENDLKSLEGSSQQWRQSYTLIELNLTRERNYSNSYRREIQDLEAKLQKAEKNNSYLQGQLGRMQQDLSEKQNLTGQLVIAQSRVEELEEQRKLLMPQAMSDKVIVSFFDYLRRLDEAAEHVATKGVLPQWSLKLNRGHVNTLFYSYDPSEITFAVTQLHDLLEKAKVGEKRVLAKDVLLNLSRILGYYNLYIYLLQVKPSHKDSLLLQKLCDLSVPTWQLEALASDLDAATWLAKHMPPEGNVPNSPCCYTFFGTRYKHLHDEQLMRERQREEDKETAPVIIEFEKQNLLDFRKSLYMALSVLSPVNNEDAETLEMIYPSGQVRVKEVTHEEGSHTYHLELSDTTFLSKSYPFWITIPPDNEVTLEEEAEYNG